MANRLADSTSPYLLQHAENPVDWYPWGAEAFAKAKEENKPIFLSVGYSSCHWCHVMAHESFEDEATARVLNEKFVCIKVDREERPDVDEAYMTAVQLTSGRGGWPMSVFMTPERRPFFAGTYFPPEDRGQVPGFKTLLGHLSQAWTVRRPDIEKAAREVEGALRQTFGARLPGTFSQINSAFIDAGVKAVLADFDPENGGFGGAPKFPPHSAIEFLLAYGYRESASPELRGAALTAAIATLYQMCLGGIRDHVGGGFHRYSTDAEWRLPHFEKMLYDNGLMLANLIHGGILATQMEGGQPDLLLRAAGELVEWLVREMRAPDGTFYSAIDADSEGEEGRFYTWTVESILELLGADAEAYLEAYSFEPEGNFEDEATRQRTGRNIPLLRGLVAGGEYAPSREKLLAARERRVRPLTDNKSLVAWNGIVIGALADAMEVELALGAAEGILQAERTFGRLPHMITDGVPMGEAYLEDYANFIDGLIRLAVALQRAKVSGEQVLETAIRLTDEMVALFRDEASGAFYSTSERHEELFGRTTPVFDQPIPSGNAVAVRVLAQLGRVEEARLTVSALAGWMEKAPGATEALYLASLYVLGDEAPAEAAPEVAKPAIPIAEAKISLEMTPREIRADGSGVGKAELRIRIPEGMHLNSDRPPARWLVPTEVKVQGVKSKVTYPPAVNDRFEGEITVQVELTLGAGQGEAEFEVTVSHQMCTETECLPSTERRIDGVIFR